MTVAFFGHRDAPAEVQSKVYSVLVDLIQNQGADMFLIGKQGRFDSMVYDVLLQLKKRYPHIQYRVVLAYMPEKRRAFDMADDPNTVFPEVLEKVPPRFAIDRRNRWMVEQADVVVTYILYPFGGAATYKRLAENKKKPVINLAEFPAP